MRYKIERRGLGGFNNGVSVRTTETKVLKIDAEVIGKDGNVQASINGGSFAAISNFPASTASDLVYYLQFKLSDYTGSAASSLYDQARLKCITIKIQPRISETQSAGSDTQQYVYTSFDYDGNPSTTVQLMAQEPSCREHSALKPIIRTLYPKVRVPVLNTTGTVTTSLGMSVPAPWLTTANSANIPHFGFTFGLPQQGTARIWDFQCTYHIEYRERQQ